MSCFAQSKSNSILTLFTNKSTIYFTIIPSRVLCFCLLFSNLLWHIDIRNKTVLFILTGFLATPVAFTEKG